MFYNKDMRKFKIFFTLFILYEFTVLTILWIRDFCVGVFNYNFCTYGNYKYFLMCVMVPVLVWLVFWWTPDVVRWIRGEKREQSESNIFDFVNQFFTKQKIERFLIIAAVIGIQKFLSKHPKTKEFFDNVSDIMNKK